MRKGRKSIVSNATVAEQPYAARTVEPQQFARRPALPAESLQADFVNFSRAHGQRLRVRENAHDQWAASFPRRRGHLDLHYLFPNLGQLLYFESLLLRKAHAWFSQVRDQLQKVGARFSHHIDMQPNALV